MLVFLRYKPPCKFKHLRKTAERWLADKIDLKGNPVDLADLGDKINDAKLKYSNGSLKCIVLENDVGILKYSPELLEHLANVPDQKPEGFQLHADGTYYSIPNSVFPKKCRKKQFLTLMVTYHNIVSDGFIKNFFIIYTFLLTNFLLQ